MESEYNHIYERALELHLIISTGFKSPLCRVSFSSIREWDFVLSNQVIKPQKVFCSLNKILYKFVF